MKNKGFISIQVPEEIKTALTVKAEAEEINLSQLCRRILKRHIEADGATAEPATGAEQAKAA